MRKRPLRSATALGTLEIMNLRAALTEMSFTKDEEVLTQGEPGTGKTSRGRCVAGDEFYILVDGEAA